MLWHTLSSFETPYFFNDPLFWPLIELFWVHTTSISPPTPSISPHLILRLPIQYENLKKKSTFSFFKLNNSIPHFFQSEVIVDICNSDGFYSPVQFNDLSAFCADRNGERIEEFSVAKNSSKGKSMNCKCARVRKLLMENGFLEIPECCSNGNYKKLTCRRGFCYCVDADGKQVSVEVIDIHRNKLPCSKNECN